jgi:hypothetical protein
MLVAEAKDPQTIAGKAKPLAQPGEIGRGRNRDKQLNSKGPTSEYLTARIARDKSAPY